MMKKIKFFFVSFLFLSLMVSSQNAPKNKWAVDKCTKMKTQIQQELKLTDIEAATYFQIMLDKTLTTSEKIRTMSTLEEKRAYHKAVYLDIVRKMYSAFPDKAEVILQWNKENQNLYYAVTE